MKHLLLFAVNSSLVVEYEETCARVGIDIAAAIQNRPGPHSLSKCQRLLLPQGIDAEIRKVPFICPLFTPANRWTATAEAVLAGLHPSQALIDPSSVVASSVEVGRGSYINSAAVIAACTRIGSQVVVNRSASIGHHGVLEDYVSIGPGALLTAHINVGRGALVGAGSVVLPKIQIGSCAIIAAGSVVSRDVPERTLVMGNPARIVKKDLPDGLA
jgi:sugar O-acyltransferase (sialic acid O-acetyltransferase NeuD family)